MTKLALLTKLAHVRSIYVESINSAPKFTWSAPHYDKATGS